MSGDGEKSLRSQSDAGRRGEQKKWGETATDFPTMAVEVAVEHRQGDEERRLRIAMAAFADDGFRWRGYTSVAHLDGSLDLATF